MKNQHSFVRRTEPKVEVRDYTDQLGWYVEFQSCYYPNDDLPSAWHPSESLGQIYNGKHYWLAGTVVQLSFGRDKLCNANILKHFDTFNEALEASKRLANYLASR